MTNEAKVAALAEQVCQELTDHMRDLQKYGPEYIAEYVKLIVGPQKRTRPNPHFHPKLAELVRELALDAVAMDRRAFVTEHEREAA